MKQTKEPEFQREHPIIEFEVLPFTTSQPLSELEVLSKGRNVKTIRSRNPEIKKEIDVGKPVGLDMLVKIETEELPLDIYRLYEELRISTPIITGGLLTLPITPIRKTKLKVLFNPTTSETKEVDLYLTVGLGSLESKQSQSTIKILNEEVKEKIERACEKYAPESIQECKSEMYEWEKRKDSSIVQFCREEETIRNNMIQQQQQLQQLQELQQLLQQQQLQQQQLQQQQLKQQQLQQQQQNQQQQDQQQQDQQQQQQNQQQQDQQQQDQQQQDQQQQQLLQQQQLQQQQLQQQLLQQQPLQQQQLQQQLLQSSSATAPSSGSSLNGSRGRKLTALLLMSASIPARWPLLSSKWTKTGRIFLIDELKDGLKLLARIKESTVKRLWLLLWRPELVDILKIPLKNAE